MYPPLFLCSLVEILSFFSRVTEYGDSPRRLRIKQSCQRQFTNQCMRNSFRATLERQALSQQHLPVLAPLCSIIRPVHCFLPHSPLTGHASLNPRSFELLSAKSCAVHEETVCYLGLARHQSRLDLPFITASTGEWKRFVALQ